MLGGRVIWVDVEARGECSDGDLVLIERPSRRIIPMASAVQTITLSSSRDIPPNKDLAADIARRGCLLQSLHVRPVLDADGVETGMFEVPAGGRRFQLCNSSSSKSA